MNIVKKSNASFFVFLNALLWGSSYVWSKILLRSLPHFTLLFFYSLGGLILLLPVFCRKPHGMDKRTVLAGVTIGSVSVISNIFCMLALSGTSSSNTAFIVQMSVILTPIIMATAERKLPDKGVAISALIAVAGLVLLTFDFENISFKTGDLFALANALFFSLYLAFLKIIARGTDPVQFAFAQHIASAAVFAVLALLSGHSPLTGIAGMDLLTALVLAISVLISAVTILVQAAAIKYVRPERATVIYTVEPLAATVFAYILLGERFEGVKTVAGCMLIMAAILLSGHRKIMPGRRDVKNSKLSKRNQNGCPSRPDSSHTCGKDVA